MYTQVYAFITATVVAYRAGRASCPRKNAALRWSKASCHWSCGWSSTWLSSSAGARLACGRAVRGQSLTTSGADHGLGFFLSLSGAPPARQDPPPDLHPLGGGGPATTFFKLATGPPPPQVLTPFPKISLHCADLFFGPARLRQLI